MPLKATSQALALIQQKDSHWERKIHKAAVDVDAIICSL